MHGRVAARVRELAPALVALSHRVHTAAEIGFTERLSVAAVVETLAAQGIEVRVGVHGLETALEARIGAGSPRVGLLAEYDALPDIGHGCGHNVICATAVGAFLGLAEVVGETKGTVVLLGTPAEENGSGKEVMARRGAFDDLDAVLMLHPGAGETIADASALGLRSVEVTYHGVAAHASAFPEAGRNALDAVVAAYQGIAMLRQHMSPNDRVHGIITDGGQAANVVPLRASARFLLRSPDVTRLVGLSRRVHAVLEGAALITETRLDARWDQVPPCLPVRSNSALANRFGAYLGVPPGAGGTLLGSTDLGNVSLRVPSIHPMVAIAPEGTVLHTAEFAAHAESARADAVVVDGALALARTALDFLTDPDLRQAVRAEFEAAGGRLDVEALMAPPVSRAAD